MTDQNSEYTYIPVDKKLPRIKDSDWQFMPNKDARHRVMMTYGYLTDRYREQLKQLELLVTKYDLRQKENELKIFWLYLVIRWQSTKIHLDSPLMKPGKKRDGQSMDEYDNELADLKAFIEKKKKISRVTISDGSTSVTITNKRLISWMEPSIDFDHLSKLITGLTPMRKLYPGITNSKSYPVRYLEDSVAPFKQYLKSDVMTTVSDNEVYRFIYEFLVSLGIDWRKYFQPTGEKPQEYLRKRI